VVGKRRDVPSYTFAGVSVFDAAVIADWPEAAFPLAEVLERLMGEGRLAGYYHPGQWLDIGRPRDLMMAHRFLQSLPA
jgi:MurNAc alpha-1-phosphate uridylyltransferase